MLFLLTHRARRYSRNSQCASESDFQSTVAPIVQALNAAESEETWNSISNAILRLVALAKGAASQYPTTFVATLRSNHRAISSAASSERSRLSSSAVDLINVSASELGTDFETLLPLFLPTVLSLCSRPNKVFITRAKASIQLIIEGTQLASILPYLVQCLRDKSHMMRLAAAEGILSCVNSINPPDLEKEIRARDLESAIRATSRDANAEIRKVSRKIFDAYTVLLPHRVDRCVIDY